METKTMTVGELTGQMVVEAKRLGFSEATIWRGWMPGAGMVAKYYREQGLCVYDPAVTDKFLQKLEDRYASGEVSYNYLRQIRQITRRLNEFYLTGTLRIDATQHGTKYVLSSHSERLVDLFAAHQEYGANTRDDAVWAVRKYLCYFERLGHETLATVTIDDVQRFILKVASEVKTSTLHDLFLYLRHFHAFLKEIGEDAPDSVELFSNRVYREMPIQGYVTDEELERILNVIDSSTEVGKRNRAMILLGATTGLWACDIIRLKLTDIDWRKGEIRVEQSKTDLAVRLPLLNEAGAAIQDYILNARPQNHCSELFLRCAAPKTAIEDASSVGTMFKDYQRRARNFDRFCSEKYPDADCLTEPLALSWVKDAGTAAGVILSRLAFERGFAAYLISVGKPAYVLPDRFASGRSIFVPYIFTDGELSSLFQEIDSYQYPQEPLRPILLSVYFRLTYTCGLRPNEGRTLKKQDVDLNTGEVQILNTKMQKSRVVVMSDDMRSMARTYATLRDVAFPDSEYFFPSPDGGPYTARWMQGKFKRFFACANRDIPREFLPPVRVYDLRHRFATAVLNHWLDEKQDIHSRLPYLRTYMGHKDIESTTYYIHLLPENLVKSAGIDWESMGQVFPRAELWEN